MSADDTDRATVDVPAARERLLSTYDDLLRTTLRCADAVAADFETAVDGAPATRDSTAIRAPLRAALERAGALERYADALAAAVDAAGGTVAAPPVAAPPYVVVTSRGPALRATLDEGRFVARVAPFDVVDGTFVRSAASPDAALDVALKV